MSAMPVEARGDMTPDEVLDDVVGGKCEAALVDISALEDLPEVQAGARQATEGACRVRTASPAVIVYRKGALTARRRQEGPRRAHELPQDRDRERRSRSSGS